jgi:hypothetical protein
MDQGAGTEDGCGKVRLPSSFPDLLRRTIGDDFFEA